MLHTVMNLRLYLLYITQAGKVDMSGDAWLNISDGAKDLVKKLLNLNVTVRTTACVSKPGG